MAVKLFSLTVTPGAGASAVNYWYGSDNKLYTDEACTKEATGITGSVSLGERNPDGTYNVTVKQAIFGENATIGEGYSVNIKDENLVDRQTYRLKLDSNFDKKYLYGGSQSFTKSTVTSGG